MGSGAGLGVLLLLAACAPQEPGSPAGVVVWLADRGADAVVGLDARLCRQVRLELPAPERLAVVSDALWVALRAPQDGPPTTRLVRLVPGTGARTEVALAGTVVALCAAGERALVLEQGSERGTLLWSYARPDRRLLLGVFQEATALAARGHELVVGCARGELVLLSSSAVVLEHGRFPLPALALAAAGSSGDWWLLAGGPEYTELVRLTRGLEVRWRRPVEGGLETLAPVGAAVWVGGRGQATRFGPAGEREHVVTLPPGPWQAQVSTPGVLLLRGEGAVIEVRWRAGWARPWRSQGGFGALEDLVRLR